MGLAEKRILQYEKTVKMFKEAGCPTLETEWQPSSAKWKYVCSCGNIDYKRPNDFKNGQRCFECGRYKKGFKYRAKFCDVINALNDGDTYVEHFVENKTTKIVVKCKNWHTRKTAFSDYKKGKQCVYCFREHQQGINHPNWNEDRTSEQRKLERKTKEDAVWRKSVFERDLYTCQKCNQYGGQLEAHHIEPYKDFEDSRLCIDNGITLCKYCHSDFHWEYGLKECTNYDFYNFMDW